MSDYHKILEHPDRDQIISRLTSGDSVREVSLWLKEKYPEDKRYQVTFSTLDQFRRNHLNIHGNILSDLKSRITKQQIQEIRDDARELVKRNKTYNEKLDEMVNTQVDWRKRLNQFVGVMETRFAQLFDITQTNPNNYKPDRVMIDWMKNMLEFIKEIRKAEGAPDQVIQHNVTVQAIDDQAFIFQQAFINTLSKLDLQTASMLIDDFNINLKELAAEKNKSLVYDKKEIDKIETMVAKLMPDTDDKE